MMPVTSSVPEKMSSGQLMMSISRYEITPQQAETRVREGSAYPLSQLQMNALHLNSKQYSGLTTSATPPINDGERETLLRQAQEKVIADAKQREDEAQKRAELEKTSRLEAARLAELAEVERQVPVVAVRGAWRRDSLWASGAMFARCPCDVPQDRITGDQIVVLRIMQAAMQMDPDMKRRNLKEQAATAMDLFKAFCESSENFIKTSLGKMYPQLKETAAAALASEIQKSSASSAGSNLIGRFLELPCVIKGFFRSCNVDVQRPPPSPRGPGSSGR